MNQISLSAKAYREMEAYAKTFGVSIEYATNKAILRWMDAAGYIAMDVYKKRKRSRRSSRETSSNLSSPGMIVILHRQQN